MNIEINNISKQLIEADLRRLFIPFGEVDTVELLRDKLSNRSTGRAFVSMPVEGDAERAILSLNKSLLAGKIIAVTTAVEQ